MSVHKQFTTSPWAKTILSIGAVVTILATLVAGAIESRVRVAGVEDDVVRVEKQLNERDLLLDAKLDCMKALLNEIRVSLGRLDQRVDDWLRKESR